MIAICEQRGEFDLEIGERLREEDNSIERIRRSKFGIKDDSML